MTRLYQGSAYEGLPNPLVDLLYNHESVHRVHRFAHHFEIYHRLFSRFRGTQVRFLEIGVTSGGAFEIWRKYFGKEAKLYGVDIQDRTIEEQLNVKFWCGDQSDQKLWDRVLSEVPVFDIILDDGSHQVKDQRITFKRLFPIIDRFGIYVCEDIATSFAKEYGGGVGHKDSFVEYLKGGWDAIHGFLPDEVLSTVFGISVYNNLAVIEKYPSGVARSPVLVGQHPDDDKLHQDD